MLTNLSVEEKRKLRMLKGFSSVLADYVFLIDHGEHPSRNIQEAIEAIEYYSRLIKKQQWTTVKEDKESLFLSNQESLEALRIFSKKVKEECTKP